MSGASTRKDLSLTTTTRCVRARVRWLCGLLLMLGTAGIHAQPVLEVYETYWPAEKLVPIVKPELGPGDTLQVFRNKLVIRAGKDTHDRVAELLEAVDRAPKNLLVSLRKASGSSSRTTTVYRGSSTTEDIETRTVSENVLSTRNDATVQQVRVLEGEEARISLGEETPTVDTAVGLQGLETTTRYRATARVMYVVPQITRKGIRLSLSSQSSKNADTGDDRVATDHLQTVVLAEEGFWTPVGGTAADTSSPDDSITWSTRGMQDQATHYEIKVDILP
jgi:type II secretory pathway component GspD/PulD (secretin)